MGVARKEIARSNAPWRSKRARFRMTAPVAAKPRRGPLPSSLTLGRALRGVEERELDDAAWRRAKAAAMARDFPVMLPMLADGRLHRIG